MACSTFLKRWAAVVRNRTVANGDSTRQDATDTPLGQVSDAGPPHGEGPADQDQSGGLAIAIAIPWGRIEASHRVDFVRPSHSVTSSSFAAWTSRQSRQLLSP